MVIAPIIFVLYMLVGVFYARHAYAIQQFNNLNAGEEEITEALREARYNRDSLNHGICNLNYPSLKYRGCDCSKLPAWKRYNNKIKELESGLIVIYNTSVWNFASFWPLHMTSSFMKGGTVKKANPALIRKIEKQLEIGQNDNLKELD